MLHKYPNGQRPLFGNVGRLPQHERREMRAGSGAGRHVGGQDVVRVAVEVLAGLVVSHRGARIGVPGGDLHIAQVSASVEHGRDKRVARHVRVCAGDLGAGGFGEGCRRRVAACRSIRAPRLLSRIGPRARLSVARSMARPAAGGSGTRTTLVPLPHTRRTRWPCSSPRSPMSALVASKIRKPSSPSIATRAKSHGSGDWRAAVSRAPDCRWVNPRAGDSGGTAGRWTCSAGECSRARPGCRCGRTRPPPRIAGRRWRAGTGGFPASTGCTAPSADAARPAAAAQQALGTTTKKDTVNAALREVTALAARRCDLHRLTSGGLPDLEDEDVMQAAWQR
jgi:Arc/MetJ family transcription regulator